MTFAAIAKHVLPVPHRRKLWCCLLLLGVMPAAAQPVPVTRTAFVDVNVVPMDRERVLTHQTVLVENGRITAIGPSVAVPKDARVIDGHGTAFLSPGLADMHTHAHTAEDMRLYLANGVTSVLNLGEASNEFMAKVRPAINRGAKPGPHVYAAFLVDGSPRYGHFTVTTPDEARWIVRLAKTNGYEFIKIYNNLSPECFQELIAEGRRLGLPIVGHGVTGVGLERQLDAGQLMVAHTEEFLYTFFSRPGEPEHAPDPARIPAAIDVIRRNKAFVTADLNTYATIARQWGQPDVVDGYLRQPEAQYLSPSQRIDWKQAGYAARVGNITPTLDFLKRFTKAMSDAGVPLILGTDAPTIPGLAPGYAVHEDMRALEDAGLTRYEVLSSATHTPGEMIHRAMPQADTFGTVTEGKRADLILSAGNPLDDLSTLRKPLGVMANGTWYSDKDLQGLLDELATTYGAPLEPARTLR
ncbi:amidohydrolase family protein [Montanilutibacter psychrotolerans]|uniref:Amidohydrolase n=1 Tax=Montanilutibacter psychrotolerans TaxID=1327343 RepID=A0A3M8SVA7_9GAMM|nr:amidohydrolase family protein [Lysobacter psychrotolerans]RNF82790.1 amidohydrolase [Lysobacter psychrotolerans]